MLYCLSVSYGCLVGGESLDDCQGLSLLGKVGSFCIGCGRRYDDFLIDLRQGDFGVRLNLNGSLVELGPTFD
jgi:hypothetical protein